MAFLGRASIRLKIYRHTGNTGMRTIFAKLISFRGPSSKGAMSFLKKINEISQLIPSYQVRDKLFPVSDGELLLAQPKDLDPFEGIAWERVMRIRPVNGKTQHRLERGDILLTRRAVSFTASLITEAPAGAVASPYLFHLRPDTRLVLPDFLLWHLCLGDGQAYVNAKAEGPLSRTLREDDLLHCPIAVPPFETQAKIVDRFWTLIALNRNLRAQLEVNLQLASMPAVMLRQQGGG